MSVRRDVVLHHGVACTPDDMSRIASLLSSCDNTRVLVPSVNSAHGTWAPQGMRWLAGNPSSDGVSVCGMRFARYLVDTCEPPCRLSLVSHSFGGLVAREAVRILHMWSEQARRKGLSRLREALFFVPAADGGVEMDAFVTLATPHLGAWHGTGSLQTLVLGRTGEDISLSNDSLLLLATSQHALCGLRKFRDVVFYGCADHDSCVPAYSALATAAAVPAGMEQAGCGEWPCRVADELRGCGPPEAVHNHVWTPSAARTVLRMLAGLSTVDIRRVPVHAPAPHAHQLIISKPSFDPRGVRAEAVLRHLLSVVSSSAARDSGKREEQPLPLLRCLCTSDPKPWTAMAYRAGGGGEEAALLSRAAGGCRRESRTVADGIAEGTLAVAEEASRMLSVGGDLLMAWATAAATGRWPDFGAAAWRT
eukprot:TRINITY_DN6100_c0_g1_i3.p1 TRINITY_DN6100_c0_g1~~TRINITY_DN6100_c0_g1_i3.p1  ORF type:complete len:421 (+),score=122.04 TRINITY_DN6100_c0_g1_i3:94-1356(+)